MQDPRIIDDMLPFVPGERDVRVARGDYIFYVRAVRRGSSLRMSTWDGDLPGVVAILPFVGLYALAQRRARWKVGVVRLPSPGSGTAERRIRVMHLELLTRGASPDERIAELAADVRKGRFEPGGAAISQN